MKKILVFCCRHCMFYVRKENGIYHSYSGNHQDD